jgi:putative transposase
MNTRFYDTDVTDAAWAWVGQVLPAARPVGRPRTTNLRAVLNAIFYLLRTGCLWRLLPREFPPCGTVYHYFRAWQNSGVWVHLHRVLYEQARRHAGREACPSVVIIDGQFGQDDRAWWCSWFRRTQAGQGTQTHILVNRPCMRLFKHPLNPDLLQNNPVSGRGCSA